MPKGKESKAKSLAGLKIGSVPVVHSLTNEPTESSEIANKFSAWLQDKVGLEPAFLHSLQVEDNDWTFVIKMYAILEVALSHLILSRLREPKLTDVVRHLETNNDRRGKLGFIKAYGLLSDDSCQFVRVLSKVRVFAVHDFKNFDLNLVQYSESLKAKGEYDTWTRALTCWSESPLPQELIEYLLRYPRVAIYDCCMMIMLRSFYAQPEWIVGAYERYLSQEARKRAESTPTEQ